MAPGVAGARPRRRCVEGLLQRLSATRIDGLARTPRSAGSPYVAEHAGAGVKISAGRSSRGWPQILSGLETLLETGETLTTPESLT